MGVSTILGLALGIGVLLVIGVSVTSGSLGQSLDEGFGILENRTDYSIPIVARHGVSAEKRLSDAAKYVYHRAKNNGCADGGAVADQNDNGGYPGLQGTYLTQTPTCAGVTEFPLRGGLTGTLNFAKSPGQDMEGIFSRVYFHIPENGKKVVLTESGPEADTWLEKKNILAAAKGNIMRWSIEDCNVGFIQESIGVITDTPIGTNAKVTYQGTGSNYIFFFSSDAKDRVNPGWVGSKGMEHLMYCTQTLDFQVAYLFEYPIAGGHPPVVDTWADEDMRIELCPGDRGYIQVNKGKAEGDGPRNEGEAGESITGADTLYPHIQVIRSPNPSC